MNDPYLPGYFLAALVGGCVAADALQRGKSALRALGWGVGVWLALIVFLPLYLILRRRETAPKQIENSGACLYCGLILKDDPAFCPGCSKMLKSSNEIHKRS